ncbi:MAG: radical SAM protein [Clostridiales bacterium]|nr:radical SAM protein [Clostridiales bacterium]
MTKKLTVNRLISGGIITNYYCSSKCKHCSYSSSPDWDHDYMTGEMADKIFKILKRLGCHAVHIGGGEPLLLPEKLLQVLKSAKQNNIGIEYIETNASWFTDKTKAMSILTKLQENQVDTLLISMDPYHNEYIPFRKVKGLIEACRKANMGVFHWLSEFWADLDSMDDQKTHSLEEYGEVFGQEYLTDLPGRYGLSLKGRAFHTYRSRIKVEPLQQILENSSPCRLLSGTHHFHVDLYGNFIPQSCPGFSINLEDLAKGADPEKYKILSELSSSGIHSMLDVAISNYGYKPKSKYAGKCDLCYDIRRYLVLEKSHDLPDLQPKGHYEFV